MTFEDLRKEAQDSFNESSKHVRQVAHLVSASAKSLADVIEKQIKNYPYGSFYEVMSKKLSVFKVLSEIDDRVKNRLKSLESSYWKNAEHRIKEALARNDNDPDVAVGYQAHAEWKQALIFENYKGAVRDQAPTLIPDLKKFDEKLGNVGLREALLKILLSIVDLKTGNHASLLIETIEAVKKSLEKTHAVEKAFKDLAELLCAIDAIEDVLKLAAIGLLMIPECAKGKDAPLLGFEDARKELESLLIA